MAKYVLKEPEVDILKVTGDTLTLEDGSTVSNPAFAPGVNYILQTKTVISDADVAAQYDPVAESTAAAPL